MQDGDSAGARDGGCATSPPPPCAACRAGCSPTRCCAPTPTATCSATRTSWPFPPAATGTGSSPPPCSGRPRAGLPAVQRGGRRAALTTALRFCDERWPLASTFVHRQRGRRPRRTSSSLRSSDGPHRRSRRGRPLRPLWRDAWTSVLAVIEDAREAPIETGADRAALQGLLPPGAARNALDCALWDLEAKTTPASRAWTFGWPRGSGSPSRPPSPSALVRRRAMADAARAAADPSAAQTEDRRRGRSGLGWRRCARAAPNPRLIVDANEAFGASMPFAVSHLTSPRLGVALIEQPLKAGGDAALEGLCEARCLLCADESIHTRDGASRLRPPLRRGEHQARQDWRPDRGPGVETGCGDALGLKIMAGCMVATSLAMAPALLWRRARRWPTWTAPCCWPGTATLDW